MVIPYLPQQNNTWLKSATEALEITHDNSNENIFKKQPPDVFYKKSVLKYSAKLIGKQPGTWNFI